jgi:hypothetical protein
LYPSQLSGCQQQLVAVARAVIEPKVILADEPAGNLHSTQGREIMELFKRLNERGDDDRPDERTLSRMRLTAAASSSLPTDGSSTSRINGV